MPYKKISESQIRHYVRNYNWQKCDKPFQYRGKKNTSVIKSISTSKKENKLRGKKKQLEKVSDRVLAVVIEMIYKGYDRPKINNMLKQMAKTEQIFKEIEDFDRVVTMAIDSISRHIDALSNDFSSIHLGKLNYLFDKAVSSGDLRIGLDTLKEIGTLMGIDRTRIKISNINGLGVNTQIPNQEDAKKILDTDNEEKIKVREQAIATLEHLEGMNKNGGS